VIPGARPDPARPEITAVSRSDSSGDLREFPTPSRFTLAILALAMLLGGYLRFADLGRREMSADEGASWAAAAAPTIHAVLVAQSTLNPGKAGIHDLALHLWIRMLGDRLAPMRALSATLGTLTILLVFGAAREFFAAGLESGAGACPAAPRRDEAAAIAALIFAANLVTIKYSREVRMYPVVIAAVVAQTWCFFHAMRGGRFAAHAGVAIFTAIALAAHVMAALAFTGEALWLAGVLVRDRFDFAAPRTRRALALAVALGAGAAMLAPLAPAIISGAAHAADIGAIDWIKRPPPWEPFALFNKATGSVAFPVMAALAIWAVVRGWSRWHDAMVFALLWMWTPPIVLMFVSYAIRPVFVERYLISCFVPFFILIAIGIAELRAPSARFAALGLTVALALGHMIAWDRKPHDTQWHEAVRFAATSLAPPSSSSSISNNATLAVAPGYAVNVVRYYLL